MDEYKRDCLFHTSYHFSTTVLPTSLILIHLTFDVLIKKIDVIPRYSIFVRIAEILSRLSASGIILLRDL